MPWRYVWWEFIHRIVEMWYTSYRKKRTTAYGSCVHTQQIRAMDWNNSRSINHLSRSVCMERSQVYSVIFPCVLHKNSIFMFSSHFGWDGMKGMPTVWGLWNSFLFFFLKLESGFDTAIHSRKTSCPAFSVLSTYTYHVYTYLLNVSVFILFYFFVYVMFVSKGCFTSIVEDYVNVTQRGVIGCVCLTISYGPVPSFSYSRFSIWMFPFFAWWSK